MIKVLDYGKSMYGGWYCNFLVNGKMNGIHSNTYNELIIRCKVIGITLQQSIRVDR